ncbi:lecithin retinol acyltransferase family protein [Psychrobacter lutiphocae]|uniref:lecithin retinol acyltransferase family protein n=1 Tax=Psychrobacter lutiphocae TaxID=540500 RepID=UPI000362D761|nr:lecithin retinol acyltransferase family protein [Psychrobacter lutiphocae]
MTTQTQLKDIKVGDHLVTKRLGYTHHGIYLGRNKVIHYAGFCEGFKAGKVEITSFEKFSQQKPTYVLSHPKRKYSAKHIIERAKSRLNEDKYHLLFNNCEHFVNWCIEDTHKSQQVNNLTLIVGVIATLRAPKLAVAGGLFGFIARKALIA